MWFWPMHRQCIWLVILPWPRTVPVRERAQMVSLQVYANSESKKLTLLIIPRLGSISWPISQHSRGEPSGWWRECSFIHGPRKVCRYAPLVSAYIEVTTFYQGSPPSSTLSRRATSSSSNSATTMSQQEPPTTVNNQQSVTAMVSPRQ